MSKFFRRTSDHPFVNRGRGDRARVNRQVGPGTLRAAGAHHRRGAADADVFTGSGRRCQRRGVASGSAPRGATTCRCPIGCATELSRAWRPWRGHSWHRLPRRTAKYATDRVDPLPEPGDLIVAFSPSRGGASGWSSPGSCRPPTAAKSQPGRASGGIELASPGTWRRAESTRRRCRATRRP